MVGALGTAVQGLMASSDWGWACIPMGIGGFFAFCIGDSMREESNTLALASKRAEASAALLHAWTPLV